MVFAKSFVLSLKMLSAKAITSKFIIHKKNSDFKLYSDFVGVILLPAVIVLLKPFGFSVILFAPKLLRAI